MNASAPDGAAELVRRLFVLLKAAAVYGPDNDGYRTHAGSARAALNALLVSADPVVIAARGDGLFFNDALIRFPPGDAGSRYLTGEMRRRGVGGLEFRAEGGMSQLDAFVIAFRKAGERPEDSCGELQRLLADAGVTAITARPPDDSESDEEAWSAPPEPRGADASARRTFRQAIDVVEDFMTRVASGRDADFERPRRVVESLADQVIADAQVLFELSLIERFDEYTYAHSVNVCVYSVAIGARLGLDREGLSELGFGALFHDVGKAKLPRALIDKPDEFDEREWELMRRHPVLGAKALLAMRRPLDRRLARAVSIAFEHHLGIDGRGYPRLARPRRPEVFSRICAVADAFDAMTSGRVYVKRAMSPDEAVRRMLQAAGTSFDPLLLRVFINAAGVFPIGTAVLLNTGERGVVARNAAEDPLLPQVVVFTDGLGRRQTPALVDLARPDVEPVGEGRSIRRTLDPRAEGIDAAEILRGRPATAPPRPESTASGFPGIPRR
ncbi:MAG: HD-GYP domain-containing protein [Elusimicrobiota bacterium]